MQLLQRPANVARQLMEINFNTMGALLKLTGSGFQQYMDLNAQYVRRMSSPDGLQNVLDVQRDYGKSLVEGIRGDLQERGEVLRSAFEQTSGVLREGMTDAAVTLEDNVVVAIEDVKSVAADARDAVSDAFEGKVDERLEQINGIGAAFAEQLREAGVLTLAQIALLNLDDLEAESHPLHAMKGRMEAEGWIEQARELLKPL